MTEEAEGYPPESDDEKYKELAFGSASLLAAVLPEMSESGAIISKSPMAVNYTVDELTTIPSSDESHKVLVAIVPFEATISPITTPLAYLQVSPLPVPVYYPTCRPAACSAR